MQILPLPEKGKMNQVWQARDKKYFQGKDGSHAEEEEQHQSTRF